MSQNEYPDSPRVGVGAIVFHEGKVLLVRRGIAPSKGLWAIPGGGLKLGETIAEAAEREILEETGITICAGEPVYSFDFIERDDRGKIRFHYVIVDVIADYISGEPKADDDADDARWFLYEEFKDYPMSQNTVRVLEKLGFGRK